MEKALERVADWSAGLKLAAAVTAVCGVALAVAGWQGAARQLGHEADAELEQTSITLAGQLGEQISRHVDVLISFQGLFRASDDITRSEFHEHFETLRVAEKFPGMLAVQYGPVVSDANKDAFVAAVRADRSLRPQGYPDYAIRPAGRRAAYAPVLYNEPMTGNEAAFGYDFLEGGVRLAVLERARDTGQPSTSAPFALLQGGQHPTGFVVRVPVYRRGAPTATEAQRRAAFVGLLSGVYRASDLIAHLVDPAVTASYHVTVHDLGPSDWHLGDPRPATVQLFDSGVDTGPDAAGQDRRGSEARQHVLDIGGRMWSLHVSHPPVAWSWQPYPLSVLGGGLAATLCLVGAMLGLSRLQAAAARLARGLSRSAIESETRLKAVIDHTVDGILTLDEHGTVLTANPAIHRIFSRTHEQLVGASIGELVPRLALSKSGADQSRAMTLRLLDGLTCEMEGRTAKGQLIPLDVSVSEMELESERLYVGIVRDLRERKASEAAIEATRRQLNEVDEMQRVTVQCAPYAIFVLSRQGLVLSMNPAAEALLGWRIEEIVGRQTLEIFHDPEELRQRARHLSARIGQEVKGLEILSHYATDNGVSASDWTLVHRDGDKLIAEMNFNPLRNDNGEIVRYLAMAHDVTARRHAEHKLQHLALHDALTGLPNRNMLQEHLKAVLARSVRDSHPAALMFLDLDRFKKINDSLGHHVGDSVLIEVAQRLRSAVRNSDIVARLGGDEFVVLCPVITSPQDVHTVTEKLMAQFREPIVIGAHELRVTPSIGVAMCPEHGTDASTLMRHADQAMYHAKNAGRNAVQVFDPELDRASADALQIENELYHATERNELVLHFQPQFECATGKLVGAEALLRWRRNGTMVSPADFIPIAEETGLIVEMGAWVLREACQVARRWHDAGRGIRIAVNLSAIQLDHADVVDHVAEALNRSGLPPSDLELEITESVIVRESLRAAQTLERLRALGPHIAIDDFGVGYSSFSYLRELPVDRFKIDRSFLSALPHSAGDCRLVAALIAMAHRLEVGVVAEGVETKEQLTFLQDHGCDEVQGFYLGKPMPEEAFNALLQAQPMTSCSKV
jgi:diguanylate cyclase (GGDEF)-like protein/PAS domain S-box-containing protein